MGNYSGIPGAVFAEAGLSVQAWARWINDQGGIKGRRVRVVVLDDGGDPSRHRTLVQQAVENRGVVAFVASFAPLTGNASVDYLNSKGVPMIGGQGSDPWWPTSPVHFPTIAAADRYHYSNTAATVEAAKLEGLRKFGVISCVEAASCQEAVPKWEQYATQLGMEVVYSGSASIAQPDFTAECLSARNRGVEVFMIGLDGASLRRLASSCARQGFRPKYMQPGEGIEQVMLDDPNLEGLVTGSAVYPVLLGGTRAADAVRDRINRYMGKVDNVILVGQAWLAAMVLQRALENVDGEVTSAAVLRGLWQIKNEDFDGLSAPVTYREAAKSNQLPICYFVVEIRKGALVSPDGAARHCVDVNF